MAYNEADLSEETQGVDELQRLAESNPWWKEVQDEMFRALSSYDFAEQLELEHRLEFSSVIIELAAISPKDLEQARQDEVFKEAREIIANLNPGDPFPDRLAELYELQKIQSLEKIKQEVLTLISLLSSKRVRQEVQRLWDGDRSQLISSSKDLPEMLKVQDVNQRYIVRSIAELAKIEERLQDRRDYPFSSDTYHRFTLELIYLIHPSEN